MKKQQETKIGKPIKIQLNSDTLTPINDNLSILGQLKYHHIIDKHLKRFYQQRINQETPFYTFTMQPLEYQLPKKEQQSQDNNNKSVLIFDILGYKNLQEYVSEDYPTSLLLQKIGYKIIQIFLFLIETNLYLKINKTNILISNGLQQDKQVRILAVQLISNIQQFINQLKKIIKLLKIQSQFNNLQQLTQLYTKMMHSKTIDQNSDRYLSSLCTNRIFFGEILNYQTNAYKNILKCRQIIDNNDPLAVQDIQWVVKELDIKNNGYYLQYRSSTDGFQGTNLWNQIQTLSNKDREYQLIVLDTQKEGIKTIIGFISSSLTTPQNKQLMKKNQKFGCYLKDLNNKKPSYLINFSKKTIHPLKQQNYCIGYNPNKYLLCLGKCDIIVSNHNVTSLCYFPVSYSEDSQQSVIDCQAMCGGRQFTLNDIYLYRLKK